MEAVKQQKTKERAKRVQYKNRKSTLLKGGKELSILCNINVCVVILSPDGKLETWPENLDDVRACFRDAAKCKKRPRSDNSRKRVRHNPSQVKIDDDDKRVNKKMKTISDECHVIGNNLQVKEEGDRAGVLVMAIDDDDDDDDKRANRKMKTISDDCHVIGNNLQVKEEGDRAGVLVMEIDDDDDDKRANKKMKTISDDSHVIGNNLQVKEGDRAGVLVMGNKIEGHHYHQPSLYNCCGNYYPRFSTFGEWNNNYFAQGIGNYENQSCCHHHHHEGCCCSCVALYGSRNGGFLVGDSSCSNNYVGGGYESLNLHNNHLHNNHLHKQNNDHHASGAAIMFHPLPCQQSLQSIRNPKKFGRDFQFGKFDINH